MTDGEKHLLVDASVVISLTEIGELSLLGQVDGRLLFPESVVREVSDEPAATRLDGVIDGTGWGEKSERPSESTLSAAGIHLDGNGAGNRNLQEPEGDVELLAYALERDGETIVVTDDRPLRETCNALSIPVSGSIGVLIRVVESGVIDAETARERLYAMDEVSSRLSASLVRRAERLIDDAGN